jgi:aerobic-type carbon monoxide dehydrogenase small subunit (CoxS/CutS family)
VLAIAAQGKEILTVEGLAPDGELSPVQQKFVDCDGLMCGFCTPGFIVSATALLENNASPTRDEIKRALDGNICRCGTQSRALEAVEVVARKKGGK